MNGHQNNQKIGLCGFRNIGNTCYMNSTLQLLIHSKILIKFLIAKSNPFANNSFKFIELFEKELIDAEFVFYLKNGTITRLEEKERKRLGLKSDEPVNVHPKIISNSISNSFTIKLAEIINLIIYKGTIEFTPDEFKKIVDMKIPLLRGFGQQDSHELLTGILDNIIEETGIQTNVVINNIPENVQNYINLLERTKSNISNEKIPKREIIQELNNYRNSNRIVINRYNGLNFMTNVFKSHWNPMIQKLLTFTINTTICANNSCKYEKSNYNNETMLFLNIKSNLEECFEKFIEEEEIDLKCDVCTCTKAIKTTKLWQPGMLLYIELCRFNNTPDGQTSKINTNIAIPDSINISKYCDKSNNLSQNNLNYKLKGMTNHMGNLNGGHYTADCVSIIDDSTWFHFDDSHIFKYDGSNINKSNGYMLLYELDS